MLRVVSGVIILWGHEGFRTGPDLDPVRYGMDLYSPWRRGKAGRENGGQMEVSRPSEEQLQHITLSLPGGTKPRILNWNSLTRGNRIAPSRLRPPFCIAVSEQWRRSVHARRCASETRWDFLALWSGRSVSTRVRKAPPGLRDPLW